MSRYRGPRLRIVRRLGELPGLTRKTSRKENPPGQHGSSAAMKKISQYSIRLREKQKLRYNYGISEKQLINYVKKSRKSKGSSGEILLQLLEMRLDNHGHICVNKQSVDIPSFQCKPQDVITVKDRKGSRKMIESHIEALGNVQLPEHLTFNASNLVGEIKSLVQRNWLSLKINELLVVEYYSRKV
jgi:small subunit ribosomal protein S4